MIIGSYALTSKPSSFLTNACLGVSIAITLFRIIIDIENKVASLILLIVITLKMELALKYHACSFGNLDPLPTFYRHSFRASLLHLFLSTESR